MNDPNWDSAKFGGVLPSLTQSVARALDFVEAVNDLQASQRLWTWNEPAQILNVSATTAERWLKREKFETKTYQDLLTLRREWASDAASLPISSEAGRLVKDFYYAQLTNAKPLGWLDGEFFYRVNVSRLPFVIDIGRIAGWDVAWNANVGRPVVIRRVAPREW